MTSSPERKLRRLQQKENERARWKKKEVRKKGYFTPKENNFGAGATPAIIVWFYFLIKYQDFTFWYPLIAFGIGYFIYWYFKRRGKDEAR